MKVMLVTTLFLLVSAGYAFSQETNSSVEDTAMNSNTTEVASAPDAEASSEIEINDGGNGDDSIRLKLNLKQGFDNPQLK